MIPTVLAGAALIGGLFMPVGVTAARAATAVRTPAQATATEAGPFIGEWALALQSQDGPREGALTVKADNDKVTAEIRGIGETPAQAVTDISKTDKGLVLRYTFDYQGMAVDAAVSLTPPADNRMAVQFDFASGAYVMSGTATRKEKTK